MKRLLCGFLMLLVINIPVVGFASGLASTTTPVITCDVEITSANSMTITSNAFFRWH